MKKIRIVSSEALVAVFPTIASHNHWLHFMETGERILSTWELLRVTPSSMGTTYTIDTFLNGPFLNGDDATHAIRLFSNPQPHPHRKNVLLIGWAISALYFTLVE